MTNPVGGTPSPKGPYPSIEHERIAAGSEGGWDEWGPYLSERQWGTVREDYSPDGSAWHYFPHDAARSRAYRWGEDGLGGFSDRCQQLCLAVGLWNGRDPIIKERLFGLTNHEGNHGEDVKEVYYYLDATPSHSYLRMLYKYPQAAYPYEELIRVNAERGIDAPEYELADTGVFDDGRYFDVVIEYAKASAHDVLMKITVHNRGPEAAPIHVLPHVWFRNTWSWHYGGERPILVAGRGGMIRVDHPTLTTECVYFEGDPRLLFCENDSHPMHCSEPPIGTGYYKNAFDEFLVHGREDALKPSPIGTKMAAHHTAVIDAGGSAEFRVRMTPGSVPAPFDDFEAILAQRVSEADAFYAVLQAGMDDEDARRVHRQALAGMIWCKQFYHYDVAHWIKGDETTAPPPEGRRGGRNAKWQHLNNSDILSMPDTWEYPWFAAWDLAFHCIALAELDPEFAKKQLVLLTREWYMHPNGQLPAYEWEFSDVNPPVHAWATWRVFQLDRDRRGDRGDLEFLERVFHKLLINFTWWINRKDEDDLNIFQGGFLGLDNIGLFDRSAPLPTGGNLHQSDATSWVAMYSLNLMRIALELARQNHVYEDIASKFFEHFLHIAQAMSNMGGEHIGLWDDEDKFYYDMLHLPDGRHVKLKIRSMVGLVPLFAVQTIEPELLDELPAFTRRMEWFLDHRPDLAALVSRWYEEGRGHRRLLSLLRGHRMKALLERMLDPAEFLGDHGVRALSRVYADEPYEFPVDDDVFSVRYQPAESDTELFGGNSNWRGPIWFPVNYLLIESLRKFHQYYGDDFRVEHPTGSGQSATLDEVATDLSRRLVSIFLRNEQGERPVFGESPLFQHDPHFKDYLLFYEYFHGDNGRGVGASHQTGWTGLVAPLLRDLASSTGGLSAQVGAQVATSGSDGRSK